MSWGFESHAGPGNIIPHATRSFETTNMLQGFLQKGESESFVVWSVEDTVLFSSWPQPEGASIQLNTVIAEYSVRRNCLRSQSFLSFKSCLMVISICLTLSSPKTIAAKYANTYCDWCSSLGIGLRTAFHRYRLSKGCESCGRGGFSWIGSVALAAQKTERH